MQKITAYGVFVESLIKFMPPHVLIVFKTTLNGQSNPNVLYLVATCLGVEIDHHQDKHTVIQMKVINAICIIIIISCYPL
jgi:hypothetical protein